MLTVDDVRTTDALEDVVRLSRVGRQGQLTTERLEIRGERISNKISDGISDGICNGTSNGTGDRINNENDTSNGTSNGINTGVGNGEKSYYQHK